MGIAAELTRLHAETTAVFEKLHDANDDARQQNPELRQAVSQCSAAVAALGKAARSAEAAEIGSPATGVALP